MKDNTLGIKEMKVVKTKEFFEKYIGKVLVFWVGAEPIYFSIGEIKEIQFKCFSSTEVMIFFGISDDVKFAVGVNSGFGFKAKEDNEHFWVDRVNEEEAAVIVYETKTGESK